MGLTLPPTRHRAALLGLLAAAAVASGCAGGEVVRVFDGVVVRGRFINDWAYASYARGAEWEARGQLAEALRFYEEAAAEDPDSPEIWSRIGAVSCRLGKGDGEQAFEKAEAAEANYEPLWRARATCAQARGRTDDALAHARRAVALDPTRDETVILLVRLLGAAGRHDEAERWLRSLAVASPRSTHVWQAVAELARGQNPAWLAQAEHALLSLHPTLAAPPPEVTPRLDGAARWRAVDSALAAGTLELARTRVREAHLDMRLLAARAIVLGRPALALEEAQLRLGADPDDDDARMAVLLAADLLDQTMVVETALAGAVGASLSEAGRLLFAELLLRRASREAAAAWLGVEPGALDGVGGPRQRLAGLFEKADA